MFADTHFTVVFYPFSMWTTWRDWSQLWVCLKQNKLKDKNKEFLSKEFLKPCELVMSGGLWCFWTTPNMCWLLIDAWLPVQLFLKCIFSKPTREFFEDKNNTCSIWWTGLPSTSTPLVVLPACCNVSCQLQIQAWRDRWSQFFDGNMPHSVSFTDRGVYFHL